MFTHEIIRYDEKLPVKLLLQKIGNVEMHWHESMELLMVLTGRVTVETEGARVELLPEDLILINPHEMHATTGEDAVLIALQVKPTLFEGVVEKGTTFRLCSAGAVQQERYEEVRSILSRLILYCLSYEEQDSAVAHLMVQSILYELAAELISSFREETPGAPHHSSETLKRLGAITAYLSEHYREPLTLRDVAAQQYLSVPYLSSFFERTMGVTFSQYLTSLRLRAATRDLLRTEKRIDDIAAENGFPNTRSFVSAFRRAYGVLPSKYRAEQSGSRERMDVTAREHGSYLKIEKNDYLAVLKKYAHPRAGHQKGKETWEQRLSLSVDAAAAGRPLRHTWRVFTSVGRAKELLMTPVREALADLQREIGFSYIKFHGILDDAMMVYREDRHGNPVYNFVYVDEVLDYLLGLGLKPLVQLSFMPSALALDPGHTLFASPAVISAPKDEERWCALIRALTRHLLARYGEDEVRSWLFTFWNEPIGMAPFRFRDGETAERLYEMTYRAVKECDGALRFAPPSMIALFEPEAEERFLADTTAAGCAPDFFLLHAYQVETGAAVQALDAHTTLSEDPDEFRRQIDGARALFRRFSDAPVYLTEWNFSTSHRDWLNDTCFRACFLVRNILENYDELESFGIWTATDYIEELSPGHALFHGGMGLYARGGIPKPARLALGLLRRLGDTCIHRSEGCFVTRTGDGGYAAILYHYQHFSSLYAKGYLLDKSPDERYSAFAERGDRLVTLTLENMEDGAWDVTEYVLNRKHGSAFDAWQDMGAVEPERPEEFAYLKALARPALRRTEAAVSGGTLLYEAPLAPNEVRLLTLRRKK